MPGISEPAGSVHLALVLHFHQPVGNFGEVFERVTAQCYRPLLELLVEHPDIKCHLHLNGILLAWFDDHQPDLIAVIDQMVRRGSAEMITGGHQEPVLSVLPEQDAVGQVLALSDELERRFGARAKGAWLTERVYEPHLPTRLHKASVRYISLDDTLLGWAGLDVEEMTGAFVTEDGGRPLTIFPAAKALRYSIPFRPHDESLSWLHALHSVDGEPPLAVYADDVEKFGEWPGTHEWVWERGWLRGFFERLEEDERIVTVHLSDELERRRPVGMIYPPAASYQEMTVWALPTPARHRLENLLECPQAKAIESQAVEPEAPETEAPEPEAREGEAADRGSGAAQRDDECGLAQALPFVRGSHWRGFLAKYPEALRLHRRMLAASRRYHAIAELLADEMTEQATNQLADQATDLGARPQLEQARRDLYRGQCNDAYWHGSFGGLYLAHLRRELQAYLIRCERSLDRIAHDEPEWLEVAGRGDEAVDPDRMHARNAHLAVVVDPDHGGAVVSWDLRESCEDWINVMQRHEEPFHRTLRELEAGDDSGASGVSDDSTSDDGIATIHGTLQLKDEISPEDLEVDRHSRVGGLSWIASADLSLDDVLGLDREAVLLSGRWEDELIVSTQESNPDNHSPFSSVGFALNWERPDLHVRKIFRFGRLDASIEMELHCESESETPQQFLSEWNLLCSWTGEDLELLEGESVTPAAQACRKAVERLTLVGGGGRRLDIECSPPATVSWSCVHTISSSEAGLEKMGQGTALVIGWPLESRLDARLRLTPHSPARGDEPVSHQQRRTR